MLRFFLASRWICATNLFVALNFVVAPTVVDAARSAAFAAAPEVEKYIRSDDASRSFVLKLTRANPDGEFLGAKFRTPRVHRLWGGFGDASVLIHCDKDDGWSVDNKNDVRNLTADCSSYSIYSTSPIIIELPYRYDDATAGAIDERAIKNFRSKCEFAAIGNLQPISPLRISRTSDRCNPERSIGTLHCGRPEAN